MLESEAEAVLYCWPRKGFGYLIFLRVTLKRTGGICVLVDGGADAFDKPHIRVAGKGLISLSAVLMVSKRHAQKVAGPTIPKR